MHQKVPALCRETLQRKLEEIIYGSPIEQHILHDLKLAWQDFNRTEWLDYMRDHMDLHIEMGQQKELIDGELKTTYWSDIHDIVRDHYAYTDVQRYQQETDYYLVVDQSILLAIEYHLTCDGCYEQPSLEREQLLLACLHPVGSEYFIAAGVYRILRYTKECQSPETHALRVARNQMFKHRLKRGFKFAQMELIRNAF